MTNPNDAFFGGAPTLSYPKADNGTYSDRRLLGQVRGGRIVDEPQQQQMTDMVTGAPQWWDQAHTRPKMQLVVTLLCDGSGTPGPNLTALDERTGPQDTGQRRLYIRGKEMTEAIRNAFTEAGAPGLRVGGELYVVWTGERPSKMKGADPARTWAAKYVPGSVGIPAQSASEAANVFGGNMPPATWGNGPAQGEPVTTPNYNQPPPNGAPNPYAAQAPAPYPANALTVGFDTTNYPAATPPPAAPADPWGQPSTPAGPPAPQGPAQPPAQPFGGQPPAGPATVNPFA